MSSPVDLEGFRASMREAGIEEIVEPTLRLYVKESNELFGELEAAVSSGDAEVVRARAHTLKGSSGSVWATELAELFKKLELTAAEGDIDGVTRLFADVRAGFDGVIDFLNDAVPEE